MSQHATPQPPISALAQRLRPNFPYWRRVLTSRRRLTDLIIKILSGLAALLGCFMLGWILLQVIEHGIHALNWDFFIQTPPPPGSPGGGMGNAVLGTLMITAMATVIGVPLGLLAGVYLAEFGRGTHFANAVRFCANILMGVPSIILGVIVYTVMVVPMHHASAYAGAIALAIMMLPIVTRTTEDMLRLVPGSLREAGLAMGAPRWRVTFQLLFRASKVGILTGVILAVARISGETAPLLFTALNNTFYWPKNPNSATANLTVAIYKFAFSPYHRWQQLAWAGAFLITLGVLLATILSRLLIRIGSR